MTLVYLSTNKPVQPGDVVRDFRGDKYYVAASIGQEPKHPASTGRIAVVRRKTDVNSGLKAEWYFPTVFFTLWIEGEVANG